MIDKTLWSPQELMVFEEYGYRCVLCGFQYADALHEEPPKSLNPNWRDEPWTQLKIWSGEAVDIDHALAD